MTLLSQGHRAEGRSLPFFAHVDLTTAHKETLTCGRQQVLLYVADAGTMRRRQTPSQGFENLVRQLVPYCTTVNRQSEKSNRRGFPRWLVSNLYSTFSYHTCIR
ncbi:unnamed protein product, partial [Ectocarpus sp. 12 AP-2014]